VDPARWASGLGEVSDYLVGLDGALWYCRQSVAFRGSTGQIRRIVPGSDTAVSVPPGEGVDLAPAFPMPASGATTLRVRLPAALRVDLRVYDARGRLVRTLRPDQVMAAPGEDVVWDGRDDRGVAVPPGLYLARLQTAGVVRVRRVVLLR
jgi:hypothetical protein